MGIFKYIGIKMPQANLRNSGQDPYLYLEGNSGSTAVGLVGATDVFNIVVVPSASDIEPNSGTPSISIDPNLNGAIEFRPKGIGQSTFVNGNVEILANSGSDGNLLMQDTTVGGLSGVIEFGGDRFIHNFGTSGTFIGENAGNTSSATLFNTGIGFNALQSLTTGSSNTVIGNSAGKAMASSTDSVAVGDSALGHAVSGEGNTAIGSGSLSSFTGGDFNTGVGSNALINLTTGAYNTAIGQVSGSQYSSNESSNIVIGNGGTSGESHTIHIGTQGSGTGQQNTCFIAGINGVTLGAPVGTLEIDASGQIGVGSGGGGGGLTWSVITGATQAGAINSGYICNFNGTLVVTLPTTAAVGTLFAVAGMFNVANNWQIAQNGGQQIFFNTSATTVGAGGSLVAPASNFYSSVTMVCNVADTSWIVIESQGNITTN